MGILKEGILRYIHAKFGGASTKFSMYLGTPSSRKVQNGVHL